MGRKWFDAVFLIFFAYAQTFDRGVKARTKARTLSVSHTVKRKNLQSDKR